MPTDYQRLAALYWETRLRPQLEESGATTDMLETLRKGYILDAVKYDAIESVVEAFTAEPLPSMTTGYLLPPLFTGRLSDYDTHRPYLYALGIDPSGEDDTVFGTDYVYCAQHLRAHGTGWCSVGVDQKVPLSTTIGKTGSSYRADDEARALGFRLFEDTKDYWGDA